MPLDTKYPSKSDTVPSYLNFFLFTNYFYYSPSKYLTESI